MPFCGCELCGKARESGGNDLRKRSSLLINDDLLIDLGQDFMSASFMHEVDTTKIRYWLQTHSHSDHFSAAHLITRMAEYATVGIQPLSLYASLRCVRDMSEQLSREDAGANLIDAECIDRLGMTVHHITPGDEFLCGPYVVTALNSGHDNDNGSYNYLINDYSRKLLYGLDADERTFKRKIMDFLSRNHICLDIAVLDHTYGYDVNMPDHLNANKVIEIIDEMKKRGIANKNTKIFASHISHEGNLPHDEFVLFANRHGYDVAFDGLTVIV
jgi:phosphoribosyl 1,2-cyclic phosphate phosphodiesterase